MREIKFRAFDIGKGCFIDVLQFTFNTPTTDWKIYGFTDEDVLMRGGNNDIILMQYTGIKDKNGVEIYEGDIVKIRRKDNCYYSPEFEEVIEVERPEYVELSDLESGGADGSYPVIWMEVIGNIYENPELLE